MDTIDSLSDVLFKEAIKHNLVQVEKEAPEIKKMEADSIEHRYYKSRLAEFGNKNAIIMYESRQHISRQYPPTLEDSYENDNKSICANGKLFIHHGKTFGVGTYKDPNEIKKDSPLYGNKSTLYSKIPSLAHSITSNHGFTLVDFVRDAKNLEKSLEAEIALVRGMK